MSQMHGISCSASGCRRSSVWTTERGQKAPTKSVMEAYLRKLGWNAPDKLGNHWCPDHRRPDGRKRRAG